MKPHGTYKLIHRARRRCAAPVALRAVSTSPTARSETLLSQLAASDARLQRLIEALRREITDNEEVEVRVRKIFSAPRSIYRLEIFLAELGYQRITLLEEDALEELLMDDGVRAQVEQSLA